MIIVKFILLAMVFQIYVQRRNYSTSKMKNQEENCLVIYLNETWANTHRKDTTPVATLAELNSPVEKD